MDTNEWEAGVRERERESLSFVYLVQWLRQPFFGRVRWLKQICLSLIVVWGCSRTCCRFATQHPHRQTPTLTHTHTPIQLCIVLCVANIRLPASCYAPTKSQRFSSLVLFLVCLFVRVQIGYCDNNNSPYQTMPKSPSSSSPAQLTCRKQIVQH